MTKIKEKNLYKSVCPCIRSHVTLIHIPSRQPIEIFFFFPHLSIGIVLNVEAYLVSQSSIADKNTIFVAKSRGCFIHKIVYLSSIYDNYYPKQDSRNFHTTNQKQEKPF